MKIRGPSSYPFALRLGLGVAGILAALVSAILVSAPAGMRWLGDTIQNPSDAAVYLSYLRQGADGSVLLRNLFAVEPHAARFDVVWSTLGLLARIGVPVVAVHEVARFAFAVLLAFAVHAAARSVATDERNARLASVLAFAGIGTGWIHSLWLHASGTWGWEAYGAPDLVTEFSLAPVLLGGAHAILSVALLLTGLRAIWNAFERPTVRRASFASAVVGLLLLFHPYFAFVFGPFVVLTVWWLRAFRAFRMCLAVGAALLAGTVPAAVVYVPLLSDPVFVRHHATVNALPLAPAGAWIATLVPFLLAVGWRAIRKVRLRKEERWLVAWIAAAVIALLLPLPFKRKLTEGVAVALVFLSLPAWAAIRDRVALIPFRPLRLLQSGTLLLAAALSPLHLAASQLAWIAGGERAAWFYRSDDLFAAWDWLRARAEPKSVVVTDDKWTNVWTPAYAGRTVWVAHDHETPDYARKRAVWNRLIETHDPFEARALLASTGATHLLLTSVASRARFLKLLGAEWAPAFSSGDVTVLVRMISLASLCPLPSRSSAPAMPPPLSPSFSPAAVPSACTPSKRTWSATSTRDTGTRNTFRG